MAFDFELVAGLELEVGLEAKIDELDFDWSALEVEILDPKELGLIPPKAEVGFEFELDPNQEGPATGDLELKGELEVEENDENVG